MHDSLLRKASQHPWLLLTLAIVGVLVPLVALTGMVGAQLRREFNSRLENLGPETQAAAETIRNTVRHELFQVERLLAPDFRFAPVALRLDPLTEQSEWIEGELPVYTPQRPILRRVSQLSQSPFEEDSSAEPSAVFSAPGPPSQAWANQAASILAFDEWMLSDYFSPYNDEPFPMELVFGYLYAGREDRAARTERLAAAADRVKQTYLTVTTSSRKWSWHPHEGNAILSQMIRVNDSWKDYGEFQFQSDLGDDIGSSFWILHGFEIERSWVLGMVERIAAEALDSRLKLCRYGDPELEDQRNVAASLDVFSQFNTERSETRGAHLDYFVLADTTEIRGQLRRGWLQIFGFVGFVLTSLTLGLYFLVSGVRRELLRAEKMDAFTAMVSHELRTPLATIELHVDMLRQGLVDNNQRQEYYERIAGQNQRLSHLVDGILERARLTNDSSSPARVQTVEIQLSDQIRSAGRELVEIPGLDLVFNLKEDLPPVKAPPSAIHRILSNLVENARKYGTSKDPEGQEEPVEISTSYENGRVVLEVADRGPGIPLEDRARIFDAFQRIPTSDHESAPGTGLGLHLVALHASSLGAEISVLDRPGGGARFRIGFPPASSDFGAP